MPCRRIILRLPCLMQNDSIHKQIDHFLEYLEIEKNCSKLTIRDYRHYLESFEKWYSSTLPGKSLEKLDLATVRKYRVYLANRVDNKGRTLKRVTQNYYVIALRSMLRFLIKMMFQHLSLQRLICQRLKVGASNFLNVSRLIDWLRCLIPQKKMGRAIGQFWSFFFRRDFVCQS